MLHLTNFVFSFLFFLSIHACYHRFLCVYFSYNTISISMLHHFDKMLYRLLIICVICFHSISTCKTMDHSFENIFSSSIQCIVLACSIFFFEQTFNVEFKKNNGNRHMVSYASGVYFQILIFFMVSLFIFCQKLLFNFFS